MIEWIETNKFTQRAERNEMTERSEVNLLWKAMIHSVNWSGL